MYEYNLMYSDKFLSERMRFLEDMIESNPENEKLIDAYIHIINNFTELEKANLESHKILHVKELDNELALSK